MPDQLAEFREWLLAFDVDRWGQQLESDVAAGRLDRLANEAMEEHQAGRSTRL